MPLVYACLSLLSILFINSWVKVNQLFLFFHTSVYFKTSKTKTIVNLNKICEEIFPSLQTSDRKVPLNFTFTQE